MIISSVGTAPLNYGFEATDSTDELGKEDFLQLLVTQMQNQDPLNPIKNEDFVAQLAQFNSLEQMINVNKSLESQLVLQTMSSASNLIGKEVDAISVYGSSEDSEYLQVSGTVQEVVLNQGTVMLNVETEEGLLPVYLGDVVTVR